ncbi:hypothetical protein BOTNAR_0084g00330 [Botryotinia narcissicola]|uniref:Uncharacterized protein n=1 Tax=Botryotinia narcissicola TaxID=278944 RepID=A0A4Z1ITK5_9HELO|nr:hypothetical protein BOTNAR_0084g00330 [Botryotinia narcissicola]
MSQNQSARGAGSGERDVKNWCNAELAGWNLQPHTPDVDKRELLAKMKKRKERFDDMKHEKVRRPVNNKGTAVITRTIDSERAKREEIPKDIVPPKVPHPKNPSTLKKAPGPTRPSSHGKC